MKIAAMAAGAVGGYFGARMAAAGPRRLLHRARRPSRRHPQERPQDRKRARRPASAEGRTSPTIRDSVGPVDIVLFAVKLWDTETAAELTRPLVGPDTRVITLQNGVDSVERVAPILGAEHDRRRRRLYRHRDRRARA